LKHKYDVATEFVLLFGQQHGRANEPRCVHVVAAGVHDSIDPGTIRPVALLCLRQCVDVRPQADGGAVFAAAQHEYCAGFQAQVDFFKAEMRHLRADHRRGFVLLQPCFGVHMHLPHDTAYFFAVFCANGAYLHLLYVHFDTISFTASIIANPRSACALKWKRICPLFDHCQYIAALCSSIVQCCRNDWRCACPLPRAIIGRL
jgi:hypothetical protein